MARYDIVGDRTFGTVAAERLSVFIRAVYGWQQGWR